MLLLARYCYFATTSAKTTSATTTMAAGAATRIFFYLVASGAAPCPGMNGATTCTSIIRLLAVRPLPVLQTTHMACEGRYGRDRATLGCDEARGPRACVHALPSCPLVRNSIPDDADHVLQRIH